MVDKKSDSVGAETGVARLPRPIYRKPMPRFEWSGVFENYARKYVKKHLWRVAHILGSEEDAMQEAAVVFYRCRNRYEGKVDNPAWFMSLFKIALVNEWASISAKDSQMRSIPIADPSEEIVYNDGELVAALSGASEELQILMRTIANAPAEFLGLLLAPPDDLHSSDPALVQDAASAYNRRIKRLLGISKSAVDIVSEARALLT